MIWPVFISRIHRRAFILRSFMDACSHVLATVHSVISCQETLLEHASLGRSGLNSSERIASVIVFRSLRPALVLSLPYIIIVAHLSRRTSGLVPHFAIHERCGFCRVDGKCQVLAASFCRSLCKQLVRPCGSVCHVRPGSRGFPVSIWTPAFSITSNH